MNLPGSQGARTEPAHRIAGQKADERAGLSGHELAVTTIDLQHMAAKGWGAQPDIVTGK